MKLHRKSERKFFKAQRERSRMLAINKALLYLRNVLQSSIANGSKNYDFHHLPKIEVLKMAKNYIAILQLQVSYGDELTSEEFMELLTINLKNSTTKLLKRILLDN